MAEPIEFVAEVVRVKTMADGGLRFEFGVGESYIQQAAMLMECKRAGAALTIKAEPHILTESNDETKKGAEASPDRVGRRRLTKRRDQPPG